VQILALVMILSSAAQGSWRLPVTIEVKQDVPVTNESQAVIGRGKLYSNVTEPFVLKKGQRFQMVAVGQEGACRIRFGKREFEVASCPWLEGFRDHQRDVFSIVTNKR
jgi:hypothetical protein